MYIIDFGKRDSDFDIDQGFILLFYLPYHYPHVINLAVLKALNTDQWVEKLAGNLCLFVRLMKVTESSK